MTPASDQSASREISIHAPIHMQQEQGFGANNFNRFSQRNPPDTMTDDDAFPALGLGTFRELCGPLLGSLRMLFQDQFEGFSELSNIDQAIILQLQVVSSFEGPHEAQVSELKRLAALFCLRFERFNCSTDLGQLVLCCDKVLSVTPDGRPSVHHHLHGLSMSLQFRFQHLGDYADIDRAIICSRSAVLLTLDNHADQMEHLSQVTGLLHIRSHDLDQPQDLDEAVAYGHRALQICPDNHPMKITFLNQLGISLKLRFPYYRSLVDIDQAIACQDQALMLAFDAGDTTANTPQLLANLGSALLYRFRHLGRLEDINLAVNYQSQAVELAVQRGKNSGFELSDLGLSLVARHEQTGEPVDITAAIDSFRRALSVVSSSSKRRVILAQQLAPALLAKFELTDDIEDLDEAIMHFKETLTLLPDGAAAKPMILGGLGNALMLRFDCLEQLADIDDSISFHIQSMSLTPDTHPKWATRLANVSGALIARYCYLGQTEDLKKAIEYDEQGIARAPDDAGKYSSYYALGISLIHSFLRSRTTADINRAVSCFESALDLIDDGHIDKLRLLTGLAQALTLRFEILHIMDDIDRAIACSERAIVLTPDGHPKHGPYRRLAQSYANRFDHSGNLSDLNEAIEYITKALVSTTTQYKATRLTFLGNCLRARSLNTGDPESTLQAVAIFQQAAELTTGSPLVRFWAACKWARLTPSQPLEPYQSAIDLLPQIFWIGVSVQRRYEMLSTVESIAVEGAAAAIHRNRHEKALEWLEQGRSIVWQQLLNLRASLDDLHAIDPALANRLETVARHLDRVDVPQFSDLDLNSPRSSERLSQQHRQYAQEWERLLEQARTHPGFDDFLRPITASRLLKAPRSGPVVVISIASGSCDALVLLPGCDTIGHVPLADFSFDKASHARSELADLLCSQGLATRGVRKDRSRRSNVFGSILAQLWSDVVKPVLDHLGYTTPVPIQDRPHVTWCTTGPLAFLPLHAAGLYTEPDSRVYNYVVSSYTPTLAALLTAQQSSSEFHGVLAVGQANTAGQARLPGTTAELAHLKKHAEGLRFTQLDGADAMADRVLAEMEANSWVHLACHAVQNPTNPTKSAFLLGDSTLDLATIMGRSFRKGGLAYLSACQTATGDEKIPEEAVHLAAGMMMAGYSSVIATMWSIKDADAPMVANRVYERLMEGGVPDIKRAARALDAAVVELRDSVGEKEFGRWVPYIHIGV